MVAVQMYFMHAMESLRSLRDREEGQGLVEYALILALVSAVSIGALTLLGTEISTFLTEIAETIEGVEIVTEP